MSDVPTYDKANIRVTRNNSSTEFSMAYQDGERVRTCYLRLVRIFHPVRGEEVQIEIEAGRRFSVRDARSKRQTTRGDKMIAQMHLSPIVTDELIAVLQGKPKGIK